MSDTKANKQQPIDLNAEISKLIEETVKINRKSVYYPLVVGALCTLALIFVVATVIK